MKDLGRAGPTKVEGALYAPDRGAIYMSRRLVRAIVESGIARGDLQQGVDRHRLRGRFMPWP